MAADVEVALAPNVAEEPNVNVVDVDKLAAFILNMLVSFFEPLANSESESRAALDALLRSSSSRDHLFKFISDGQCRVLFVEKAEDSKEEESMDVVESKSKSTSPPNNTFTLNLSTQVRYSGSKFTAVAFIKRGPLVEAEKSLHAQMNVLTLNELSPFGVLHDLVASAVAPFFKSFVRESGKTDRDGDKMANNMEKKITELEMGLLHLQQNIDIPEISLPIHPLINKAVKIAESEKRSPAVLDVGDVALDSVFLNALQNLVSKWIREIQKVTKLDRDPSSGTALQEISFWLNLERALHRIQEKRESPEIILSLEVLKHGKRFHATVSFDTDTGLKQATDTVHDYNPLMKDFPIHDLLAATELERIRSAILLIFSHLRKIRNTRYPIQRALRLVEAISRDLTNQLLKVLNQRRLMFVPFDDFEKIMSQCFDIFSLWDDEYDKLQGLLRDVVKRKREEHLKMVWRVSFAHKKLQSRAEHMRRFRRQHEQLRAVIMRVLRPVAQQSLMKTDHGDNTESGGDSVSQQQGSQGDADANQSGDLGAIQEVNVAYESVKDVDALDISKEGSELWEAAMKRYEECIDRVEARITTRLRDQLGTAKNAHEMFRIFSRYNALFVRPHIRGAIREYQTQLIQRVKDDIESLHTKFKVQYPKSKANRMSSVRDLPPVAGSVIWAKQIDRQLTTYMHRVEDVLGKGWEMHVEGQKLKADGDSFRKKLNTQEIFEEWSRRVQQRNLAVSGRIFAIDNLRNRSGRGSTLKLRVNFLPEIIQLSKEVRNLKSLGFRVPLAIVNKAHQANQLYPFAISMIESLRTYDRSLDKIESHTNILLLVAGLRKEVHNLISEGVALVWESFKLDPYVQRLAEIAVTFQERVDDLLTLEQEIDVEIRSLETCNYSSNVFKDILAKIQKAVDDLSLHQYSNLGLWVSKLDAQIEEKLAKRLQAGIEAWINELQGDNNDLQDDSMDTEEPSTGHKLGGEPKIRKLLHEIRITNQIMYLHPSIEDCQHDIFQQLFSWQAVITGLERIQSSRYNVNYETNKALPTYKDLLTKLPGGSQVLEEAYKCIKTTLTSVSSYVDEWLRYQALWDLQPESVVNKVQDLSDWMRLLADLKRSRTTFDTSETSKEFGPIIINFVKVQSKVSLKYDAVHKDVLGRFGHLIGNEMLSFHSQITKSRVDLEQQTIDTVSTSEAVNFITEVQALKRQVQTMEQKVNLFREGQKLLERQRFQFPNSWLHADNVEGEWSAFNEILKRKNVSIQAQVSTLQVKVMAEDKQTGVRTEEFLDEWDKSKPIEGHLKPKEALQKISLFESRFTRLKEERDNLEKAKEALEIEGGSVSSKEKMGITFEELQDLKSVWTELTKICDNLDELREIAWSAVQPRKIRQQIDALLAMMKEFPSRLRQYSSYEFVKRRLQSLAKANMLVVELKSDALKDRHWKVICKELRVRWILSELTLGQVWDTDLLKNESIIRDVLVVAQGEKALEEFLKQLKELWQEYELELINYQNKCKIIKGWDELFTRLKENLSQLSAMKASPYFKVFEEEALTWEDKLSRISNLFDVWIEVQRRWVYLETIFTGNSDIGNLLPVETSRFNSISSEFLAVMKKVAKSNKVLDVLNIQGIQRSLERLSDLLAKVQKALGDYLERERSSFPRFYFVGDEDLLEVIGNSKNLPRLQRHFKKMFAGINSTVIDEEDETLIKGMASKEGEIVPFLEPVSSASKINEWLMQLESQMRKTLAQALSDAVESASFLKNDQFEASQLTSWCSRFPAQIVVLAAQVLWTSEVEDCLNSNSNQLTELEAVLTRIDGKLRVLSQLVLKDQEVIERKKLEHLIFEYVHRRSITRKLIGAEVTSNKSFLWLSNMRFYFDSKQANELEKLSIHMSNAHFFYGFEYLGVQERLVMTPLTDRSYLSMTHALNSNLGGSPFGPAGTGKTETVKALGNQLGRFVLVFNCDETFDFQAMGRIFVGLCQVGAWGCFDEFNRLEERMLSAVSQQIQAIQEILRQGSKNDVKRVELIGKQVKVSSDMAIFVTMNPGYAGRSNLPDNLKKLFRSVAMTRPNETLIAEVMLFAQGFADAELLSRKVVTLFKLCTEQLSPQSHYDFGLRALKSVLTSAGNLNRQRLADNEQSGEDSYNSGSVGKGEQVIILQSVYETMVPKLISEDKTLLLSLLADVFPKVNYPGVHLDALKAKLLEICSDHFLCCSAEIGQTWMEKVIQLYQITQIHHGLMMVGPTGSGKSAAWRVLLKALEKLENIEGVSYVIDPKALSKEQLYGALDANTREWSDGLFTAILRKILDNVRGESEKRHWIIFDGDVDPDWVENLNSVLDDNRLLTLPNGERLPIPKNVRIMFEVQDLKFATLATVSRCGMVWFSDEVVTPAMLMSKFINEGRRQLSNSDDSDDQTKTRFETATTTSTQQMLDVQTQEEMLSILAPFFEPDGLVDRCLSFASTLEHIMTFTNIRGLSSLFSLVNQSINKVHRYNGSHPDFPLSSEQLQSYLNKAMVHSIVWGFTGDATREDREQMSDFIRGTATLQLPNGSLLDYYANIEGEWESWQSLVPELEVETHKVGAPDVVIPTTDTVRNEHLLYTWLAEHKPLVLCGPPGSGKTMTLFSSLRALPELEVVGLNFSSATTPDLILRTFDQYCEYKKTAKGVVLAPTQIGKWLVMFCDEINLPSLDEYGTQRVISFIRQLVEQNGFYRDYDHTWITLERIQFVGACNPPTDPGRQPLPLRFLRHIPVVYVDYPGEVSLKQIYGTFNRALLRLVPALRNHEEALTSAMVEFFQRSKSNFTVSMQPHYVYSPREMTRWVKGIYEAIKPLESLTLEALVRLFAHEALRLFHDRLVLEEERLWTMNTLREVTKKYFISADLNEALKQPILYSNWMTKHYLPVEKDELSHFIRARLKVFYEEELDVPLVLFDQVLDHVLRIDRIFRQNQGHLLLIGVSGAGKTTLSRFVAWINGLSVFQLKVHNKYGAKDFDEDLRTVLRRSGCKNEKICFILDEANVLESGFLERMNTLLANGEVPGLFEGDDFSTLMTQCKEAAHQQGLMLDSSDELYKWFTTQVMKNLHIVFTMNPSESGLKSRAATSPALFNRCVLNWFGDWSDNALFQVAKEFTLKVDVEHQQWHMPDFMLHAINDVSAPNNYREALMTSMVLVHKSLHSVTRRQQRLNNTVMAITPRHFLDFIHHFVTLYQEKRRALEDEQFHVNVGLKKIKETVEQVEEMQKSLAVKSKELEVKNEAANAKLKQMVHDQQEAEKQKSSSQGLRQLLETQKRDIAIKRKEVMEDLEQVEPAVIEAQQAVKSIKKQHLVEVRSMANPPSIVKLALESICLLLGESTSEWKSIRSVLMRDNFIGTIVNFSTDEISDDVREKMKQKFLSNPDFNYEKVDRASHACGPLVKWAIAQLEYADMLKKVEPLRNELKSLENSSEEKEDEVNAVLETIKELETSIAQYKDEYAQLISQAEAIKSGLKHVQDKVSRSMSLLSSLSIEQERWKLSSENFKNQMETLVGDVFLSAAFLAYSGFYDQKTRSHLSLSWRRFLTDFNIEFRDNLALTEFLTDPDMRAQWQRNSLPSDDLCIENATMLKRFNRFPLIIDPSGQATNFLLNEYKEKNIVRTSFLDNAFRKNLESALRFGNPLLVQDVENYDPILNPVLNRELKRTGGRVLISLADQEIDLSPSFTIILSTRDPSVQFQADLCSRVTMVNFTVTRSSLQMQCLHQVLKSERPEIDEKRSDLLKLQGEFRLRLRYLEKQLLKCLNEAKGGILDDDALIATLETLKNEAKEISVKAEETDEVMNEVEKTSQLYMPLAKACSNIYFSIENLHQLNHLYQFSLQFFLEIFQSVLKSKEQLLSGITDTHIRLDKLTLAIFEMSYRRVARAMLHDDKTIYALALSRVYLEDVLAFKMINDANDNNNPSLDKSFGQEFDFLMTGFGHRTEMVTSDAELSALVDQLRLKLQVFNVIDESKLKETMRKLVDEPQAESSDSLNLLWSESKLNASKQALCNLVLINAVRPDRVLAAARRFVTIVINETFIADTQLDDYKQIVEQEVSSTTPVLLCSTSGYDSSDRVVEWASMCNKELTNLAMGSAEGYSVAEQSINNAVKSGRWVLLKNVHLSPNWLASLEKKLHSIQPHPSFRLFLTCEITPKLPTNLLRAGRILAFEAPPGIKANLMRTMDTLGTARSSRPPNERARLHFMLAWFHGVVQERLRYVPLGWSKHYEFNESDLRVACDMIDDWLDSVSMGRANVNPHKIPWQAIQTLLKQVIYGGKLDNEQDQHVLDTFVTRLFSASAFDEDFPLVSSGDEVIIKGPDGFRRDQFISWIRKLPPATTQSPIWLGLPNSAETLNLMNRGQDMLMRLLRLRQTSESVDEEGTAMDDESDELKESEEEKQKSFKGRPKWMQSLHHLLTAWLNQMRSLKGLSAQSNQQLNDPLYRFFSRETQMAKEIHKLATDDLTNAQIACSELRNAHHHAHLMSLLASQTIPREWRKQYRVPDKFTVTDWIDNFVSRWQQLKQINEIIHDDSNVVDVSTMLSKSQDLWLGGFFYPEAFLTAVRQCLSQRFDIPLEAIKLNVEVNEENVDNRDSFPVAHLMLHGAVIDDEGRLCLRGSEKTVIKRARLKHVMLGEDRQDGELDKSTHKRISVPLYLNSERQFNLMNATFVLADGQDARSFVEMSVALSANP